MHIPVRTYLTDKISMQELEDLSCVLGAIERWKPAAEFNANFVNLSAKLITRLTEVKGVLSRIALNLEFERMSDEAQNLWDHIATCPALFKSRDNILGKHSLFPTDVEALRDQVAKFNSRRSLGAASVGIGQLVLENLVAIHITKGNESQNHNEDVMSLVASYCNFQQRIARMVGSSVSQFLTQKEAELASDICLLFRSSVLGSQQIFIASDATEWLHCSSELRNLAPSSIVLPDKRTLYHVAAIFDAPRVISIADSTPISIDSLDVDHKTALHLAVQLQHASAAEALVDSGASLLVISEDRGTL